MSEAYLAIKAVMMPRDTNPHGTRRAAPRCSAGRMDHLKLTYRFQGRDFRLTDVGGKVVKKLLA